MTTTMTRPRYATGLGAPFGGGCWNVYDTWTARAVGEDHETEADAQLCCEARERKHDAETLAGFTATHPGCQTVMGPLCAYWWTEPFGHPEDPGSCIHRSCIIIVHEPCPGCQAESMMQAHADADPVALARDIELAGLTVHMAGERLTDALAAPADPGHLADPDGHAFTTVTASAEVLTCIHVAVHQHELAGAIDLLTRTIYRGRVAMTETSPGNFQPYCPCGLLLHYRGDFGAPGFGQSWQCEGGHGWAKAGGNFHDPAEGAHLLTLADVR